MRGVADLEDWEVDEFFRLSEDDAFLSDFLIFLSLSDLLLCLLCSLSWVLLIFLELELEDWDVEVPLFLYALPQQRSTVAAFVRESLLRLRNCYRWTLMMK